MSEVKGFYRVQRKVTNACTMAREERGKLSYNINLSCGGPYILMTTEQGKRKLSMWKKKELKENLLCKDGLETQS